MVKPALTNRYSNFDFPEYKFVEFPKAVIHNGKSYVVNDAHEEKALLATTRDYHKEALERAAQLKIEIPEDWSLAKIQAMIKKTESDIEFSRIMDEENKVVGDKDATKSSLQNKLTLNKTLNK